MRCETSTTIPSSPQARTSARPASVRPGPWSGEPGKPNGTPVANALRAAPHEPERAQAGGVQDLELVERRCRSARRPRGAARPRARRRRGRAAPRATRSRPPEARSIRSSSATWARRLAQRALVRHGLEVGAIVVGVVRRRGGEDREARPGEAAARGAREVEMARRRRRRGSPPSPPGRRRARARGRRCGRRRPARHGRRRADAISRSIVAGGHRLGEQAALRAVAAELAQPLELLRPLDALRDDGQAERARHLDDRRDDRRVVLVAAEAGDERAVDLEHVEREALAGRRATSSRCRSRRASAAARTRAARRARSPARAPPPSARSR